MQTLTPIIHSFNTNCVPDTVLGTMKQEWIKSNTVGEKFQPWCKCYERKSWDRLWWEERCSGACPRSEMLYTNTFICVLAWKWYLRSIWDFFGRNDAKAWNSSTLATSCEELTHWKRLWCWEGLGAGEEGDQGWDGWMASLTQWARVWVNSGSWWWTGRPGVLGSVGSQRVGHDWATELNWTEHRLWHKKCIHKPLLCCFALFCRPSLNWPQGGTCEPFWKLICVQHQISQTLMVPHSLELFLPGRNKMYS